MKKLCALAILCLSFSAHAVVIKGARSCGQWVKSHQSAETTVESVTQEAWLMGYLSGLAFAHDVDFLRGVETESMFLWTTNYCKAKPLEDISAAGDALALELGKKKKP